MTNAGMIPMMNSAKDCEFVLRHRWQWQRPRRIKALEMAHKRLKILRQKGDVSADEFTPLNGRLLQAIAEEKWRWRRQESVTETKDTTKYTPTGSQMAALDSLLEKDAGAARSTESSTQKASRGTRKHTQTSTKPAA